MVLTQKETSLLNDLKSQEQLCIEKYQKYQADAHDPALKNLFGNILSAEQSHLKTVNEILGGTNVSTGTAPTAASQTYTGSPSMCTAEEKQADGYLCRDALAMEKHVSSVYDISIFEFSNPTLRDTLAHIQKEEQNHGQQLYGYLSVNGMYS
ncbi:MAG: ferritin-like domain-containing protein [Ruminococcaceae bacterium]|nr:ferritin-like domain-containing protein [Oscillospiraceae bacterium]